MSEIDDIFASKGKGKKVSHPPSASTLKSSKKKQKRKASLVVDEIKSSSSDTREEPEARSASSKRRRLPETVIDTSDHVSAPAKRHKTDAAAKSKSTKGDKSQQEQSGLENFKDSRGTSGRRQTAEGWLIYKEDELGISQEGGDTPLCPFDCECCF